MEKFNESRLRGDYHEYVTIERLSEISGAPKENYREILERSKKLPDKVRAAIEDAGLQCADKIIKKISVDYPDSSILKIRAVGKESGMKTVSDVSDISILIKIGAKTKDVRVSLKFTKSSDGIMIKNPGMGSILKDYFGSPGAQKSLDSFANQRRAEFLKTLVIDAGMKPKGDDLDYMMHISKDLPKPLQRFKTNALATNTRKDLTGSIRDKMYDLLVKVSDNDIRNGCKILLGIDSNAEYSLTSRWVRGRVKSSFQKKLRLSGKIEFKKVGKNSVFVIFDDAVVRVNCGIRFKHMGGDVRDSIKVCSSLKMESSLHSDKKV